MYCVVRTLYTFAACVCVGNSFASSVLAHIVMNLHLNNCLRFERIDYSSLRSRFVVIVR